MNYFGRLSNAEQQRVFARDPAPQDRHFATHAETVATIPGIRFVVDTGLARISRLFAASADPARCDRTGRARAAPTSAKALRRVA